MLQFSSAESRIPRPTLKSKYAISFQSTVIHFG